MNNYLSYQNHDGHHKQPAAIRRLWSASSWHDGSLHLQFTSSGDEGASDSLWAGAICHQNVAIQGELRRAVRDRWRHDQQHLHLPRPCPLPIDWSGSVGLKFTLAAARVLDRQHRHANGNDRPPRYIKHIDKI
jgi:hypothetical protein